MKKLDSWVLKICSSAKDEEIIKVPEVMAAFYNNFKRLPEEIVWEYRTKEQFIEQYKDFKRSKIIPLLKDATNNLNAYGFISVLRTAELLGSVIDDLNTKKLVPAAVCARSMLELACTMSVYVNEINNDFIDVIEINNGKMKGDLDKSLFKLEKDLVMAFWGEGNKESDYRQINVMKTISMISAQIEGDTPFKFYKLLCEIAHPNYLGNTRFLSELYETDNKINVLAIRKNDENPPQELIILILWVLSFSLKLVIVKYGDVLKIINQLDASFRQKH